MHNSEQYKSMYSTGGDTPKINYPLKNVLVLEVEIKLDGVFFPPFSLPTHTHYKCKHKTHTYTPTHLHTHTYTKPTREQGLFQLTSSSLA